MSYTAWSVVFGEQPSAAKWNILGTNDASFNDGTGIGNAAITPNKLVASTGTTWVWTSWTPTWTNLSVGSAAQNSAYAQIGKTVYIKIHIVLSSSSFSGALSCNLPVTPKSIYGTTKFNIIGRALYIDEGVALYEGNIYLQNSTTTATFVVTNSAGTYASANNVVTGTVPHTWGNSDAITGFMMYEAA